MENKKEVSLPVIEMFSSIQGEGINFGEMVTFIRLAGCNLTCPWCDTKESWDSSRGIKMPLKEIVDICATLDNATVVITGGEPCMYLDEVSELVDELHKKGFYVALETNGTLPTPKVDWVTVSPKPENNYKIHPECRPNEIKVVVTEELDVDKHLLPLCRNYGKTVGAIFLQPNGEEIKSSAKRAFNILLKYRGLRLGMQLHKLYDLQ